VNGTLPSGITASPYDPLTGTLTLTGMAPHADYQAALQQIEYSSTSASPGTATRLIEVVVSDGTLASDAATSFIHVIDSPPTLDLDADNSTAGGTDYAAIFTEGGASTAIADADVIIAGSTNIAAATITLTNPLGGDLLSVGAPLPGGITASSYDPVTGTISLTGAATPVDYEAALQQIVFGNSSDDPATQDRGIKVAVNDGIADSNATTAIIHVNAVNDPPTLAVAATASYVENAAPVTLSPMVSVADLDDPNLTLAVVAITAGARDGDSLTIGGSTTGRSGAIQFEWLPDVQHLIFFGPGTPDEYQALLQSVQFSSTSDDPTGAGADPTRTLSWIVFDGATPVTETSLLNITAVNDPPAGADASVTLAGGPYLFTATDFGFTDIDGNGFLGVEITTLPTDGTAVQRWGGADARRLRQR